MIPTRAVAADAKTHIRIGIDVIFHVLVVLCYEMFYSSLNFSAPAEPNTLDSSNIAINSVKQKADAVQTEADINSDKIYRN